MFSLGSSPNLITLFHRYIYLNISLNNNDIDSYSLVLRDTIGSTLNRVPNSIYPLNIAKNAYKVKDAKVTQVLVCMERGQILVCMKIGWILNPAKGAQ